MAMDKKLERVIFLDALAIILFIGMIIGLFYLSGTIFKGATDEPEFLNESGEAIDYEQVRDEIEEYRLERERLERAEELEDNSQFITVGSGSPDIGFGVQELDNDIDIVEIGEEETDDRGILDRIIDVIVFWQDEEIVNKTPAELPYSVEISYEEIGGKIIPFGKYVISGDIIFYTQYDRRFITFGNFHCDSCSRYEVRLSIDRFGENHIILEEVEDNVYEIKPGVDISSLNHVVFYDKRNDEVMGYGVLT